VVVKTTYRTNIVPVFKNPEGPQQNREPVNQQAQQSQEPQIDIETEVHRRLDKFAKVLGFESQEQMLIIVIGTIRSL
jgi:hypothetical protein